MNLGGALRFGKEKGDNPIIGTLKECRSTLVSLTIFSGIINILMLTGSFYMLQVYDRVLLSYSVPTLVMLSIIALGAYVFLGFLDVVRTRIFGRIAERIDLATGPEVYARIIRMQASNPSQQGEKTQAFRDLEAVRNFLSGTGPVAVFDMPWLPFYLTICFFLHPYVGLFAAFSCILLIVVAVMSEYRSQRPNKLAFETSSQRNVLASSTIGGSEVIVSMGMLDSMQERWRQFNGHSSALSLAANDISSGLSAMSRTLRMVIQSATLGLGAYLVIKGEMTAGTIIAASIISARAIAPVDLAVSSYRSFQQAREGYKRLARLFETMPEPKDLLRLMAPRRALAAENIVVVAPNNGHLIIKGLSFQILAGEGLGVIGHSASGKSTLARALVGLWQPVRGTVSLDGASLKHWDPGLLGRHIGYLPHDVQLFDGTIAENISRFDPQPSPESIYAAARMAGCYEIVLQMPDGFNTRIGLGGAHLSAGQRQRIGLARALYGDPFMVILDEPNANLDAMGEQAVTNAIMAVRQRGGIVVVIAHRPSALAAVDKVLVLHDGVATAYGPKDDVLKQVLNNAADIRKGDALAKQRKAGALPAAN